MKLKWDQLGEKLYETGTDHGVLYVYDASAQTPGYQKGVAWNGLTGFTESPSGAEANNIYADNKKYLELRSKEEYGATITAYTYPDEFAVCDGSAEVAPGVFIGQQKRKMFGFTCRTLIGNDTEDTDHGYKLHIVYAARVSPSEKAYETVNDSPEAIEFSWELTTTPTDIDGYEATASITIDSTKADETKLKALEDLLYGTEDKEPSLPSIEEVMSKMKTA